MGLPSAFTRLKCEIERLDTKHTHLVHIALSNKQVVPRGWRCSHAHSGYFRSFFTTTDGVEAGGRRLADEIRRIVDATPSLQFLTLLGTSLGGIYCRVAAALLLDENGTTMYGLTPLRLTTLASPHLGVGHSLFFVRCGRRAVASIHVHFCFGLFVSPIVVCCPVVSVGGLLGYSRKNR